MSVNMSSNLWRHVGCKLKQQLLTLKTVDICSRFSTVFHHIYQWVKFEIIILDDSSDIQPFWRARNQHEVIN
jgi:hypothetical protein